VYTQWRQRYREEQKAFPKPFGKISAGFLHGVGVGEGVGEILLCPSGDGRDDPFSKISINEPPFGTLDIQEGADQEHANENVQTSGHSAPTAANGRSRRRATADEPWEKDTVFLGLFNEFWTEYPRGHKSGSILVLGS
jgi:hypothetical protein